jgi:hypothetical protein
MAQHDYVIANGTGAAVRSDLNNALAAIVSQNSGATEPATMYAYQWWPDTTTGLLKIRNASNNGWVTVGTLASTNFGLMPLAGGTFTGNVIFGTTGAIELPDGTTGERPTGVAGMIRYNTTMTQFEGYKAGAWGAIGGGKILQVVRSHIANKASTTSTSLTKLATSAGITPSSSSSKIKITISTSLGNAGTGNANFYIVRTVGGSDTTVFTDVVNKFGAAAAYQNDCFSWSDLDSPSTTSAVTYSISGIRLDGTAEPFVGGRNTDSAYAMGVMFILEEVAA